MRQSLIAAQSSGVRVPDDVAAEHERRLSPVLVAQTLAVNTKEADNLAYDPASVRDERERAMRAICIRRGQPAFRAALLAAYDGRYAITDCDIEDVLEDAHISPYSGPSSDHVCNGLLQRADIHTLFDCGLLAFNPKTRQVVLAGRLNESDSAHLASQVLREPSDMLRAMSSYSAANFGASSRAGYYKCDVTIQTPTMKDGARRKHGKNS